MDPLKTHRDIIDALLNRDAGTARELAVALQRWLQSGGFFPAELDAESVAHTLADILSKTDPRRPVDESLFDVFSLTCTGCDAGMEIFSEAQAVRRGWINVEPADLAEATHLGTCPECQKWDAEDSVQRTAESSDE